MKRLFIVFLLALAVAVPAALAADVIDRHGCVVRRGADKREIRLIFSADSMFEGGSHVLDVLERTGVKGSFFLTGNFVRRPENSTIIRRIIESGHYLGSHGNDHLQLSEWNAEHTPLVSADSLRRDIRAAKEWLDSLGVPAAKGAATLPPFEWCNAMHAQVYREEGLTPVNISPGIETYRDYTVPGMSEYRSSQFMLEQLWDCEAKGGVAGAFIIFHAGTDNARTDKLYYHLEDVIEKLKTKGYCFTAF